jgi:drug/metabolite transporter (DMT)-like permease
MTGTGASREYVREGPLRSSRILPLLALVLIALIWGYTWVPLKVGVAYSDPFVFAALRTLPGGILLLVLAAALGRPLRPKALGLTILLGVLQTSGFMGLTIAALVSGGAGRTAILANTWQFWILLMAWPILGERLRGAQWLSVLLALGGLVLIVEPWSLQGVVSSLLALAGALSWGASAIVAKVLRRRHEVDLLSLTAWQTLFGSIPLVLLAVFVGGHMPEWSGAFLWSLAFTLVGATGVASFLWLYVLQEMPAGIAGLGTMGTPVVGLLASWAQLGERPTALEVVGMIVILAGLAILFARGTKSSTPVSGGGLNVVTAPPAGVPQAEPGCRVSARIPSGPGSRSAERCRSRYSRST